MTLLRTPMMFWLVSVSFVLFQFFLQLSSGVVIDCITKDITMTAYEAGFLASTYYYIYTALQIPVGMLFDKKSTKMLLTLSALTCSLGCIIFSLNQDLWSLTLSRLVIGGGSAFAFVGVSHVLREHFPSHQFGLMIGLSETLAFLATVIFMFIMGTMIEHIFWREMMLYSGYCGLVITLFCAFILPKKSPLSHAPYSVWQALKSICLDKIAWFNGLFVGFGFGFITVFGAMWAIPFIQLKTGCDIQMASVLDASLFLGAGLSCPLFGEFERRAASRKRVLFLSYFLTAILITITLFVPTTSLLWIGILMFSMGLASGAYMVSYTIANEIAPPRAASTSTGFTNTFAVLTAPLLQPLVGYFLDLFKHGPVNTLGDYQWALMLIPMTLMIGAGVGFLLPEKKEA